MEMVTASSQAPRALFPRSDNEYRIVLVHMETCPYSRSVYPAFMEAVERCRAEGYSVHIIQVHKRNDKDLADHLTPTAPAIFKLSTDGQVKARHEGRRTAEDIASFIRDS